MSMKVHRASEQYIDGIRLFCFLILFGLIGGCLPMSDDSTSKSPFIISPETTLELSVFTQTGMPRSVVISTNSVFRDELNAWILSHKDGWKSSFDTYAPVWIVKGKSFTLNVRSDAVVLNYEIKPGTWKQIVHQADSDLKDKVHKLLPQDREQ